MLVVSDLVLLSNYQQCKQGGVCCPPARLPVQWPAWFCCACLALTTNNSNWSTHVGTFVLNLSLSFYSGHLASLPYSGLTNRDGDTSSQTHCPERRGLFLRRRSRIFSSLKLRQKVHAALFLVAYQNPSKSKRHSRNASSGVPRRLQSCKDLFGSHVRGGGEP